MSETLQNTAPEGHAPGPERDKKKSRPCHLSRLPAELRVRIFEMFYEDAIKPHVIKIVDARLPSRDLLLTCKRIYQEARSIYISAFRQYWTENEFLVQHASVHNDKGDFAQQTAGLNLDQEHRCKDSIGSTDLDRITKLNVEWLDSSNAFDYFFTARFIPTPGSPKWNGGCRVLKRTRDNGIEVALWFKFVRIKLRYRNFRMDVRPCSDSTVLASETAEKKLYPLHHWIRQIASSTTWCYAHD